MQLKLIFFVKFKDSNVQYIMIFELNQPECEIPSFGYHNENTLFERI